MIENASLDSKNNKKEEVFMCYNTGQIKEDKQMSSIIVYNDEKGSIIASDSRNTHIKTDDKGNIVQYNHNDRKQKLFKFKNGVLGIYGATTFSSEPVSSNTNFIPKEINEFINPLLGKELYVEDLDRFCTAMQPLVINNNETSIICIFQNNEKNIIKTFTFNNKEIIIKNFQAIPELRSFAVFYINTPSVFLLNKVKSNKEEEIRKIMQLYIDTEFYNNDYPRIGGPIQMYKIPLVGNIENLSDTDALTY